MKFEVTKLGNSWFNKLNLNAVDFDRTRLRDVHESHLCAINREDQILLVQLGALPGELRHGNDLYLLDLTGCFFFLGVGGAQRFHIPRFEGVKMNAKGLASYPREMVFGIAKSALSAIKDNYRYWDGGGHMILDKNGNPI